VRDVTIGDGHVAPAGSVLRKVWAIKNTGKSAWPAGCTLSFIGGHVIPDNKLSPLAPATPGQTLEVGVDVRVPKDKIGSRAHGDFRLSTAAGGRFGPKIWVDLIVGQPIVVAETPIQPVPVQLPIAVETPKPISPLVQPVQLQPQLPLIQPIQPVVVTPVVIAKPVAVVPTQPQPIATPTPVATPTPAAPKEDEKKADKRTSSPVKEKDSKDKADNKDKSYAAAAGKKKPNTPIKDVIQVPRNFKHYEGCVQLRDMGYNDDELNMYLLGNNKGDVQRVVEWLVKWGSVKPANKA